MEQKKCSILTFAPYRILPAKSGGQMAITYLHHYLGMLCPDHILSTSNNDKKHSYAFQLHDIFPHSAKRYLPLHQYGRIAGLSKAYDVSYIICEHPYMAPTAMMLSKKLGIPWFLRSHNIESERFKGIGKKWWPFLKYYERFAMKQANGIFFITSEDATWAQTHFHIEPAKCHFIPYGTELKNAPLADADAKKQIADKHGLDSKKPWFYFLGVLDYAPNAQAVSFIVENIVDLLKEKGVDCEILIAGKGLSSGLQSRVKEKANVTYLGFVDDLSAFINSCDIMLNPVILGGGVKTKALEALAYNKTVVSTQSGAAGLLHEVCGEKLAIVEDNNWSDFADAIKANLNLNNQIPASFYDVYNWGNIAAKTLDILKSH